MDLPRVLKVSCVQLQWGAPIERNLERALHYIRAAADEGSRVVVFPEASLTSYHFPYLVELPDSEVQRALELTQAAAAEARLYAIVGSIRRTPDRFLNMAHVIAPSGEIIHEYAKIMMAGKHEQQYCRPGAKLSLFEIDGIQCTMVICRDGRHPELYRLPVMAGAQILFHPSCSSDEIEAVWWKRVSGRAQLPVGPHTSVYHCVANTVGQDPSGRQTSSGESFIRDPSGLPIAEAGAYQEEIITAVLDLERADRRYVLDSLERPEFLQPHFARMVDEVRARAGDPPA